MENQPISKPQQKVLDKMNENHPPFHFIPWGLNYYRLQDRSYTYLGRVRHCVFDALCRKGLIFHNEYTGWEVSQ